MADDSLGGASDGGEAIETVQAPTRLPPLPRRAPGCRQMTCNRKRLAARGAVSGSASWGSGPIPVCSGLVTDRTRR